jgi:hypothetical protein
MDLGANEYIHSHAATVSNHFGGNKMAKKTVFVSDLSGDAIEEGKGAKIRITFDDARRGSYEIDATAEEAAELGRKGRQVARRGRRPKAA